MDEYRNESRDTCATMRTKNLFLSLKNSIFSKKKTVVDKNAWKYPWIAARILDFEFISLRHHATNRFVNLCDRLQRQNSVAATKISLKFFCSDNEFCSCNV